MHERVVFLEQRKIIEKYINENTGNINILDVKEFLIKRLNTSIFNCIQQSILST